MNPVTAKIRAALGTPPRIVGEGVDRRKIGQTNLYRINEKADQMRWWMARIREDRNYSRVLFDLPLIDPSPEMIRFQQAFKRKYQR